MYFYRLINVFFKKLIALSLSLSLSLSPNEEKDRVIAQIHKYSNINITFN